MGDMTEPIYRLRSTGQYAKAFFLAVFFLIFLIVTLIDPNAVGFSGPLMVFAGGLLLAYVFFINPSLNLDREGLTAVNWFTNRTITWKDYSDLDMRLGMHIVSSTHSDIVSSFPGSGGLSRGRTALPKSNPFHRTPSESKYIRLNEAGQYKYTTNMKEAASLVQRMSEEYTRTAPDRPRTKTIDPMRVGIAVIAVALIYFGLVSAIPS